MFNQIHCLALNDLLFESYLEYFLFIDLNLRTWAEDIVYGPLEVFLLRRFLV